MQDDMQNRVVHNANSLLGMDTKYFFFQMPYWTYKSSIVKHLVLTHDIINWSSTCYHNFEAVIYAMFIYKNRDVYSDFKFFCKDDLLRKYTSDQFIDKVMNSGFGTEYCSRFLTMEDVKGYCNFLNNHNIRITRFNWIDPAVKYYILATTKIKIATVS